MSLRVIFSILKSQPNSYLKTWQERILTEEKEIVEKNKLQLSAKEEKRKPDALAKTAGKNDSSYLLNYLPSFIDFYTSISRVNVP